MAHILGIDDFYGNNFTDTNLLSPELRFSFCRLGQANWLDAGFSRNWQMAERLGWRRAPYHVIDPWYTVEQHVTTIQRYAPARGEISLPFAADCELDRGKSRSYLSGFLKEMVEAVKELFDRILIYSGAWWWDDKVAGNTWQAEYDFWLAEYPLARNPRITCKTWDELKVYYPVGWTPPLRSGGRVAVWQWSGDKFVMPGIAGPIDLNFIPENIWAEWCGEPQLTLDERVTALEGRVKALEEKV